ncbi:MAG TPA: hypothetical protein VMU88_01240 [bacterium]|nr:hypothetical protein [bacterium]
MNDICDLFVSAGISALVSLVISRSTMQQNARLNLYERRMKIYDTCYVAIRETMVSLTCVANTPVECYEGNENLLKDLVFAERESSRILSSMHSDILELEKVVHRISFLQHNISAVFGYKPTAEQVKKREEDVAKNKEELKGIKEKIFNDYKLDGPFMKKFHGAVSIKG